MTGERVYLDYNATAPVLPVARDAALRAIDEIGNPSSVHAEGRAIRHIVEQAREDVAALAGVSASQIVFTSGGTEAAILALQPAATGAENLLLAGAGEHPCVLQGHGFASNLTKMVGLLADGRLDLAALVSAIGDARGRPVTLALQAANNETGVVQPLAEAAVLVRSGGGKIVCDGVQASGRLDIPELAASADLIALSSHKLGGIKGAGALVASTGLPDPSAAILTGGGQERGIRAGTENVPAIAAFGAAARWAIDNRMAEVARLARIRDGFEEGLTERWPDTVIFGRLAPRLPNTSAFSIPGVAAETLLIALDLAGIAVSSGSACSSGSVKSSHVLDAMGVEYNLARGAIRTSIGHQSSEDDIARLLLALEQGLARMKSKEAGVLPAA